MPEHDLRETEDGDPVAGEVDEDEPDLPAVDEDALDEAEVELLTDDSPGTPEAAGDTDPGGYDPETQPEPL